MLLTLCNGLIGAVCGMWLKVHVLAPLIIGAFVEVAIINHAKTWSSVFWLAIALIAAIEVGYLTGASVAALWSASSRRGVSRDFVAYRHKSMSSH
jgi:hypothetical protein